MAHLARSGRNPFGNHRHVVALDQMPSVIHLAPDIMFGARSVDGGGVRRGGGSSKGDEDVHGVLNEPLRQVRHATGAGPAATL